MGKKRKAAAAAEEPKALQSAFVVKTLAQVGQFFGRARDTVKEWVSNGMPGKSGSYDLSHIARWRLARTEIPAAVDLAEQKKRHEIEKIMEEISQLRRKADEAVGKLVDRQVEEAEVAICLRVVRQNFERLPERLRPFVEGQELPEGHGQRVRHELARQIVSALQESERRMLRVVPIAPKFVEIINRLMEQVEGQEAA